MKDKKHNDRQNFDELYEAFRKADAQKNDKVKRRRELLSQARGRIEEIAGKPKYIEAFGTERYTYEDAVRYLKEKYSAKEITFSECLDYIPNLYHVTELCGKTEDSAAYLTEGYMTKDCLETILLLPALNESDRKGAVKRNGCILLLAKKDALLDSWWIGGNPKGYELLYGGEMYILEGKKAV